MPIEDWRSPQTIERLNQLERPGFAAEFLLRNPEYRQDFARAQRQIARGRKDAEMIREALARRWGLQFRP